MTDTNELRKASMAVLLCMAAEPAEELQRMLQCAAEEIDWTRAEIVRLENHNDQLRRDRYEALSVTSRDGLLSSEWIARTGKAESENKTLKAKLERAEVLPDEWRSRADRNSLGGFIYGACAAELCTALAGEDGNG